FQRPPSQPKQVGAERCRDEGQITLVRGYLSSFHKDLLVERNADGLPCTGFCGSRLNIESLNRVDSRAFVRWGKNKLVTDLQPPRRNPTGNDRTPIKLIHIWKREPHRLLGLTPLFKKQTQLIQTRRPAVPGHALTATDDVVAQLGTHGNNPFRYRFELTQK